MLFSAPVSAGESRRWRRAASGVDRKPQIWQHVQQGETLSVLTNPHHILFEIIFSVDCVSPLNCKLVCSAQNRVPRGRQGSAGQPRFAGEGPARRPGASGCRGRAGRRGAVSRLLGSLSAQSSLKGHWAGTNSHKIK